MTVLQVHEENSVAKRNRAGGRGYRVVEDERGQAQRTGSGCNVHVQEKYADGSEETDGATEARRWSPLL